MRLGSNPMRDGRVASTFLIESSISCVYNEALMSPPSSFFYFSVVVHGFQLIERFRHQILHRLHIFAALDFCDAFFKMLRPWGNVFSRQSSGKQRNLRMGNLSRTARGTDPAQSKDSSAHLAYSALCAYAIYCITLSPCVQLFVQALHPMQL